MAKYSLDLNYIANHSFTPRIREIWEERKSETILSRALGPDPILFAWQVIQAWEMRRIPDFDEDPIDEDDEPFGHAPGKNPRTVRTRFVHAGKGAPLGPDDCDINDTDSDS